MAPYFDVDTQVLPHEQGLVIAREQELPQAFLDSLKSERLASANMREREYHHVASVPAAVFDNWHARGLDPFNMTPRQIVAQLRKENLDIFVTTAKRV
jgi:hypothetical protein